MPLSDNEREVWDHDLIELMESQNVDKELKYEWELLKKGKWHTQHNGIVHIDLMHNSHLNNTIWMLRRGIQQDKYDEDRLILRKAQLQFMEEEQRRRAYAWTERQEAN